MADSEYNSYSCRSRNYNQPNKPDRKCPYGFTCRNHSWGQYKFTKDCKYYAVCKRIVKKLAGASLDNIEEFLNESIEEELNKFTEEAWRYPGGWYGEYCIQGVELLSAIEKHELAVILLRKHGNHQSFESLGVKEQKDRVKESLKELESKLIILDRGYIAPKKVNIDSYATKYYPDSNFFEENSLPDEEFIVYNYYRLKSKTAQFECETEIDQKCKVIHLGTSGSEKYIQGRLGIERRNRLLKIRTKLIEATKILQEAAKLADAELNHDDFAGD